MQICSTKIQGTDPPLICVVFLAPLIRTRSSISLIPGTLSPPSSSPSRLPPSLLPLSFSPSLTLSRNYFRDEDSEARQAELNERLKEEKQAEIAKANHIKSLIKQAVVMFNHKPDNKVGRRERGGRRDERAGRVERVERCGEGEEEKRRTELMHSSRQ